MTRPRWTEHRAYDVVPVASLPPAREIVDPPCMTGPAWLRRLLRQRGRPGCCWYHGVDWHAVNTAAIRIARQTQAEGISADQVAADLDAIETGLTGDDELEALESLLNVYAGIMIDDDDPRDQHIAEGRHRITAMRDAKVMYTVVIRLQLTEAGG
jgi:hypothetical protein